MATNSASTAHHPTLSGTTADVNRFVSVQVITPTACDTAGDSFKIEYNQNRSAAFVHTTNAGAADLQTALRLLTGDTALTVTGSDNTGPFTVTFVTDAGSKSPLRIVEPSGCTDGGTVVVNPRGNTVRVVNKHATEVLYFNVNSSTVPVAAADNLYYVGPNSDLIINAGGPVHTVRAVGNGNTYAVEIA